MKPLTHTLLSIIESEFPTYKKLPKGFANKFVDAVWEAAIITTAKHCQTNGKPSQVHMAPTLGINRNTLRKLINRLAINLDDFADEGELSHNAFYQRQQRRNENPEQRNQRLCNLRATTTTR
jgi:hypothetical protein